MSSISLPPSRQVPTASPELESAYPTRGGAREGVLREDPEIVLGADEEGGPPLMLVGEGVEGVVARREAKKIPAKKRRGWMFWKRSSRRAREMAQLRKGCERLAGTMDEIRDELVSARSDRKQITRTLAPLPVAAAGLQRIGEAQERTVKVLGGVQESLRRSEEKDTVFFKTMDRFGDSMANMDMTVMGMGRAFSAIERTTRQSVRTMDRLGDRLDASDRFLEHAFVRLRETEREFAEHMVTSSRRSALVTVTICLLMTVAIAILVHTFSGTGQAVPVASGPAAGAAEPAERTAIPPLDWQRFPDGGTKVAERGWPLDLGGTEGGGWEAGPPVADSGLLFVNKFPWE